MFMAETRRQKNYEFYVQSDLERHSREWVAIYESAMLAHETNVKIVAKQATEVCGSQEFLLAAVPAEKSLTF